MLPLNALCAGLVTAHIEIAQLLVLLRREKSQKDIWKKF